MAHFLVIYRPPRPTFADDATPEEERVVGSHFQFLKGLLAEGKLLLAGPCEDASMGLAVIECDNLDQAIEAAAKIPAARGGTIEVRPIAEFPAE